MQIVTSKFQKPNLVDQPLVQGSGIQSIDLFEQNPQPHTPDQDLSHFGSWVGKPIWVPPKGCSDELAKSMLNRFNPFASKKDSWESVSRKHRSKFTQVREIELPNASIRLPQGRLFVTVTERENFDKIEEEIPACVQTRLDEFLQGPGQRRGVKVFYLKPLCMEVGNDLVFTTRDEIDAAIDQIKTDVFNAYRRMYPWHLAKQLTTGLVDGCLAIPRTVLRRFINRKKKEIDEFHAKLEFERRKRAMRALKLRNKYRSDECSFDELIALTETPEREDVIDHYVQDNFMSEIDRKVFLLASATALPWFAAMSLATYQLAVVLTTTVTVATCDPAFVAQMPGSNGALLKIGHFDEVDGVMHVEI